MNSATAEHTTSRTALWRRTLSPRSSKKGRGRPNGPKLRHTWCRRSHDPTAACGGDAAAPRAPRVVLEPLQLGVKTPNGCEAIVHTARQWLHRHRSNPRKVALSVGISNAFNSIHRSCVPSLFTSRHSPVGLTAVTVMKQPLHRLRQRRFAGHLQRNRVSLLGPVPRHPPGHRGGPGSPGGSPGGDLCSFFLDDGFLLGFGPSCALLPPRPHWWLPPHDWWSTWTRPRSFSHVRPLVRPQRLPGVLFQFQAFRGTHRIHRVVRRASWAAAPPSCRPLVGSRTPKALSACYARAPGGPALLIVTVRSATCHLDRTPSF